MFRGGIACDQTPTNDTDRTSRLPDTDRVWLSVGAQYTWDKNWKFDVGFTYIMAASPTVSQYPNPTAASIAQYGLVKGQLRRQRDDPLRPGDLLVLTARDRVPTVASKSRAAGGSLPAAFSFVGAARAASH